MPFEPASADSGVCGSVGLPPRTSIFSPYFKMQGAKSVQCIQLLIRLQLTILQPCVLYGCETCAPADEPIVLLWELQSLQHSFLRYLRSTCIVKSSVSNYPNEIIIQERFVTHRHDIWCCRLPSVCNGSS